jgi:hypothetical protein
MCRGTGRISRGNRNNAFPYVQRILRHCVISYVTFDLPKLLGGALAKQNHGRKLSGHKKYGPYLELILNSPPTSFPVAVR